MKRIMYTNSCSMDSIFGMANLNPNKSGTPVVIWSDHQGCLKTDIKHHLPRIKLSKDDFSVVITIEENPKILERSRKLSQLELKAVKKGIAYVSRNYDIFLKHFNDTDFSYDDEDMFNDLRARGEYR